MIDRLIMRKLLSVRDFPTLPEVIGRILEATANDKTSAKELSLIVERDHAISAHILHMANSAFYGRRCPVETTSHAMVVLGFDTVRLLALATSVFLTLSRCQQFALDPRDFWMHSFGAAKAAQLLSRRRQVNAQSDVCYTAGLMHDMGKYALAIALGDDYQSVIKKAATQRRPVRELELEELNTTNMEVGAWLAERWKIPANIVSVISRSHQVRTYSGADLAVVATVVLADQISCVTGFGFAGDHSCVEIEDGLVRLTRLSSDDVAEITEEVSGLLDETRQFIGSMVEA